VSAQDDPGGVSKDAEETQEYAAQRRFNRLLLHAFSSGDSYGLVLILIVVAYSLAILPSSGRWNESAVTGVLIVTVWFALRTSHARRGVRRAADGLLVFAAAVAIAHLSTSNEQVRSVLFLTCGLLYVIAPFSILRNLVLRRTIDLETVLGALAVYLMVGMAFAFVYQALAHIQSGPFFGSDGEGTFQQDLFFSFTTLTTTGYGNLVPAVNPGQSLAVLEMLVGQLFLVTAVAKVVNSWSPRAQAARPPNA
jgi:Ion channel